MASTSKLRLRFTLKPSSTPSKLSSMADSVLLPKALKPRTYTLEIHPDFQAFTFTGAVSIELDVVETTDKIVFHAECLEFLEVKLEYSGNADTVDLSKVKMDKEKTTATVGAPWELKAGSKATLHMKYKGILNDNMVGFYRASFQKDGSKQWLATTQFEPIGARQALPCWDEPELKAEFKVTLVVPFHLTGISNMPEVSREDREGGAVAVTFQPSPIMSTYLLAFVVGEVECVSSISSKGVEVNVYTTPGKKEQGRFALDVACKIITFFSDYFGLDYPLPKADIIAIPDFAQGAMENWGLITFRETSLLVDEGNSPAAVKQQVAYTVSHELAHQWFGNLVTMKWWNDLWLNEGFATWVGWLGVDHLYPEWAVWTQFVSSDYFSALSTDALLGSHPIDVPIKDPKEIEQVFDALSYSKGASVIRQLEAAIGAESFKKGLHSYLSAHAYANTVTDDLWFALGKASGKPVKDLMDSWTQQVGYPMVSVKRLPGGSLSLQQTRFLSSGPPSLEQESNLWKVPISALSGDTSGKLRTLSSYILGRREDKVEGYVPEDSKWLKLNPGQTGIYRVNYSPEMWQALIAALKGEQLPVVDRLGVLADACALAKAGVSKTSLALDITAAMAGETDYSVWSEICSNYGEVRLLVSDDKPLKQFNRFGCRFFETIFSSLGWEPKQGESHLTSLLRPLVLGMLVAFHHTKVVEHAAHLFQKMTKDTSAVHPDLRRVVMASAVRYGGRNEFEQLKELYRTAPTVTFKVQSLSAMGRTEKEELVQEYLAFVFEGDEVKTQDTIYAIASVAANRKGRDIQLQYIKNNWDKLRARFISSVPLFCRLVSYPLGTFTDESVAEDVEAFFKQHPVPEAQMYLTRALEAIRIRAAWKARDLPEILAWLEQHGAE